MDFLEFYNSHTNVKILILNSLKSQWQFGFVSSEFINLDLMKNEEQGNAYILYEYTFFVNNQIILF